MMIRLLVFLLINFGALALGGLSTTKAVKGTWYTGLVKAPWTPPGWVFGAAWTLIMICFSVYMAYAWSSVRDRSLLLTVFIIQWCLNVGWNPVFFNLHYTSLGLVLIAALTVLVLFMLVRFNSDLGLKSTLLLPYTIWLFIATSLNAYVVLKN